MGVLANEMNVGVKMHCEGHAELGNPKSVYLRSDCTVIEKPLYGAQYVKVRLKFGPHRNNEEMLVPIVNCCWIDQNKQL